MFVLKKHIMWLFFLINLVIGLFVIAVIVFERKQTTESFSKGLVN